MELSAGSRLGPYEILSRIGAGGMGEVFRARDTRLDRNVAIKVLPDEFAANTHLKLRFEREARTISQLTHPNICTLYDVGDDYLVMELLEGETLADRLLRGALLPQEVLTVGAQIADALDRAHRAGVVHRDVKPGNIMITKSGAKLLDFGLARTGANPAVDPNGATQQKSLTQEGSIVGTFQYMAPEQLEGIEADPRTDIFALGAVLYEMATGHRAFQGTTRTSLIAAIVSGQPRPIETLQPMAPAGFEHVVRRCLEKDRDDRWQSARDVAHELRWIAEAKDEAARARPVPPKRRPLVWVSIAILLAVCAAALTAAFQFRRRAQDLSKPVRLALGMPPGVVLTDDSSPRLSPDGRSIVFKARTDGEPELWVRHLHAIDARPIPGTKNAFAPFWSPDGKHLGYFIRGELRRVSLDGSGSEKLAESINSRGGTWGSDGHIIFARDTTSELLRIPAAGGKAETILPFDSARNETSHRWPFYLPDGRHFLYSSQSGVNRSVFVASVDGKTRRKVVDTSFDAVYADGHLIYVRGTSLVRHRFDLNTFSLVGSPVTLATNPMTDMAYGAGEFWATSDVLAYRSGAPAGYRLTWFDSTGKKLGTVGPVGIYDHVEIAPNEAFASADDTDAQGFRDIWVFDLRRGMRTRFTFGRSLNWVSAWSPDSRQIAFVSDRGGVQNTYLKSLKGSEEERKLITSPDRQHHLDWSRDGRYIVQERGDGGISLTDLDTGQSRSIIKSSFRTLFPRLSPDGRWISYASDESGRLEVYVQRFPGGGAKWQVSIDGAAGSRWRGDSKELFFTDGATMMASTVREADGGFEADMPRKLFAADMYNNHAWDVTADGRRFLISTMNESTVVPPLTILLNWRTSADED